MTPDQIILIVLGAAALVAGGTLLRLRSSAPPASPPSPPSPPPDEAEEAPGEPADRPPSEPLGLSEPSRLTIAIVLLVVGYHLVMWALPARWASAVIVPQDRWYYVAAGAAVAVVMALVLDRSGMWREK